ncbi:hypothetical protein ACH9EU_08450 [Kocuria sp. M1R5S2]|uniref:hypothetical protein n=1 Tax=Kocuria rhizosphaerae TaxID=3376285 RepID=UPI0037B5EB69
MSEKPRTSTTAVVVLAVLFLAGFVVLRWVEPPWWVWLPALGVLAVAGVVFARFAAHAPRHERFTLEDRWATGLPVSEALERIAVHFDGDGAAVHRGQEEITVELGSDPKFRFLGVESARGRRAFPSTLTVTGAAAEEGAVLSARARDDLGWYLIMRQGAPRWAAERNAHLIDTCRRLTQEEAHEAPEAGATHLGRLTAEEPDPGPGPMDALNISNLVRLWTAWLIVTVLLLVTEVDVPIGMYAAITGVAVLLSAWLWWAERRRKTKWAARHQDLR